MSDNKQNGPTLEKKIGGHNVQSDLRVFKEGHGNGG